MEEQHVMVYVPAGIPDIDEMLVGTKLIPDRMRLVLHQFFLSRMSQLINISHRNSESFKDGWIPMYAQVLYMAGGCSTNIGGGYARYLDFLEEKEFVIPKRNKKGGKIYVNGKFGVMYKINPAILKVYGYNRKFRQERLTQPKVILAEQRIRDMFASRYGGDDIEPVHKQLISMNRQAMFDTADADQWIMDRKKNFVRDFGSKPPIKEYMDIMHAFNDGLICHDIVDTFGERLYTPISGTWRPLRQFLRFRDEPNKELVELDIANSQAYFSAACMNPRAIKEVIPEFDPISVELSEMCATSDYKMYLHICQQGLIYEYWASTFDMTMPEAKANFLSSIVYNRAGSKRRKKARLYFDIHFHTVAKMFKFVKSRKEDVLPFIKDIYVRNGKFEKTYHKNLPLMMQRMESRIIIKRVCPVLIEKGIRFLIVHDSFIAEPENIPLIKSTIEGEFFKIGIRPPKIKVRKAGKSGI